MVNIPTQSVGTISKRVCTITVGGVTPDVFPAKAGPTMIVPTQSVGTVSKRVCTITVGGVTPDAFPANAGPTVEVAASHTGYMRSV